MKYCRYCGAKLKDDYEFCCYCGEECDCIPKKRGSSGGITGLLILFLVLFLLVTAVYLNRELIVVKIENLMRDSNLPQSVDQTRSDYSNTDIQNDSLEVYRYRESQLGQEELEIYHRIVEAVAAHSTSVLFTYPDVDRVLDLAGYVYYDYPEYFWYRGSCSADYHVSLGGFSGTVYLEYTCSEAEAASRKEQLENSVQWILSDLSGKSEYEKVLGVYEYVINSTVYDASATDQSCYSVLAEHRGVCAGYANAVSYLLNQLHVDSIYVSGYSEGELHAWNLIRVAGEWYHLDATWGDPETQDGQQVIRYDYMLVDDAVIMLDHSYTGDCVYPACTSQVWNFFRAEGLYLQQYNYADLYSMLLRCKERGRGFMFRCADSSVFQETEYQLFTNEKIWSLANEAGNFSDNISYSTDPLHMTIYINM